MHMSRFEKKNHIRTFKIIWHQWLIAEPCQRKKVIYDPFYLYMPEKFISIGILILIEKLRLEGHFR